MRVKAFAASFWLFLFPLFAQRSFSDSPVKLYLVQMVFVPSALTELTTKTVDIDFVLLANTTNGAVTVLMQDETANCNSNPCQILPTVSLAANSTTILNMPGGIRAAGLKWQAGSSNAITGFIRGAIAP